jgi:deoxycytidylate deaminase
MGLLGLAYRGGSSRGAVVVTSGRIIGKGVNGTVSPNGAARSVGNYNGVTVISSGHVSGRSGSGTFRRSDGCSGTWTSSKQ